MMDTARTLEERCRQLIRELHRFNAPFAPSEGIRHELALTLDHLDRWRGMMGALIQAASGRVSSLEDCLLNLEPRTYELSEWRGERLRRRSEAMRMVARVDEQRRQLLLTYEKNIQALRRHLLELWMKHQQLYVEDGDQMDIEKT